MNNLVIYDIPEDFKTKAQALLTIPEYNILKEYLEAGKHPLAPETASALFQLFLNGSSCGEIHRLNKALPFAAILHARVKYDWDNLKDNYAIDLQKKVAEKVIKAQLETGDLLTDLLAAAAKKNSAKIKKYIQTGNEEDLGDSLSIDSLNSLMKITESLQKLIGADKVSTVKTQSTQTLNLNVATATGHPKVDSQENTELDTEDAAAILKILADSKRKKK